MAHYSDINVCVNGFTFHLLDPAKWAKIRDQILRECPRIDGFLSFEYLARSWRRFFIESCTSWNVLDDGIPRDCTVETRTTLYDAFPGVMYEISQAAGEYLKLEQKKMLEKLIAGA